MLLVADSSGLHGLSESPNFRAVKPFQGAPLDKTNGCLAHITPTGRNHSLFQLLLSSKNSQSELRSLSRDSCSLQQQESRRLCRVVPVCGTPSHKNGLSCSLPSVSNVALASPDETKAVVLEKPGPERETRVSWPTEWCR